MAEELNDYSSPYNPDLKSVALQVPPLKDKNGICCRWEFKVERSAHKDRG